MTDVSQIVNAPDFAKSGIISRAEQMQKELHAFSDKLMSANKEAVYQDAIVTFMLIKIAELQDNVSSLFRTT